MYDLEKIANYEYTYDDFTQKLIFKAKDEDILLVESLWLEQAVVFFKVPCIIRHFEKTLDVETGDKYITINLVALQFYS